MGAEEELGLQVRAHARRIVNDFAYAHDSSARVYELVFSEKRRDVSLSPSQTKRDKNKRRKRRRKQQKLLMINEKLRGIEEFKDEFIGGMDQYSRSTDMQFDSTTVPDDLFSG